MPIGSLHKLKKQKNYAVLAVILTVIVLLFCVTLIKISTQG